MLKLADLASRPDFEAGPLSLSPSRRLVAGPSGETTVEPLIMQAFLLLLDARGTVVTRQQLFDQLWGGAMVGDDSINRAIAKVRRIGSDVAPGLIEIETVPRTGYMLRLSGGAEAIPMESGDRARPIPRRTVVAGALALAGAAGAGLWWAADRREREFARHMAAGETVLDYGDRTDAAARHFAAALAIRPDDPKALGLYA